MAEWISVKDRLPEQHKQVLVCWVDHDPDQYYACIKDKPLVSTAVYHRDNWYWWSSGVEGLLTKYGRPYAWQNLVIDTLEITHWMPLLELPEGGEKNDD